MILDNENENLKVHEWITKYTQRGDLSIVTGYFTIGALAYLSKTAQDKIDRFRFILGDIVNFDTDKERALDLLNENICIDAALALSRIAREAVAFLELEKVEAKTLEPNFCHAKVYLFKNQEKDPQKDFYISGSSNLTEAGLGMKRTSNVELNMASFGSDPQYNELLNWFEQLWNKPQAYLFKTLVNEQGKEIKIPFKKYLIEEIKRVFKEYTPKDLYFKVLFELFGADVDFETGNPEFNRQIGKLENTSIYQALYEFQQKGVISLIKMLQKYHGAILADAVGLGKTWTSLAVMKYFEMQGYTVVVLSPKKLEQNWSKFLEPGNRFEKDRFDFKLRFHTDLYEERWNHYHRKNRYSLDQIRDDKPKLLVIDESHNLRNNKSNRYNFLMEEILKKTQGSIKILMLSATPINNTLIDIRNQFKLIVSGKDNGFAESLDIGSLDYLFRKAQSAFNQWVQEPDPKLSDFIKSLPPNFFRLTDALTVARTRKMIVGQQKDLIFPIKQAPENIFVTPKQIGNFESFEELFEQFPPLLSGYMPSLYTETESARKERLEKKGKGLKPDLIAIKDEIQRDMFLVKMMYILMVKRLESSWYSFYSTVEIILRHHQNALDQIIEYEKTKNNLILENQEEKVFGEDELADNLEAFSLGKSRPVSIKDIEDTGNLEVFKRDLKADIKSLQFIQSNLSHFEKRIEKEHALKSDDDKLTVLMNRLLKKQQEENKKIVIFTVYKDTAFYLFDQLTQRGFRQIAVVSGDTSKVDGEKGESKNFESILERFSPYTKLFREKEWSYTPSSEKMSLRNQYEEWKIWIEKADKTIYKKVQNPINILIATDVLSEGQNLQDADLMVNYDIHWNPVRIIQRLGRIDRIGSLNEKIHCINFWPSNNINTYLNLQGRIEQRMAAMKLAGSEVQLDFSESFREMAADDHLEQRQKDRMMEQMQSSWEEVETGSQTVGFDSLSLETFRQELFGELTKNQSYYQSLPRGIYTGFKAKKIICPQEGIIALLGYPRRSVHAQPFKYKSHELIYLNQDGESVLLNQKEVLDALSVQKDSPRYVAAEVDQGDPQIISKLADSLNTWIKRQAHEEEQYEDGSVKQKMGKAPLDLLNKLKAGSKQALETLKTEGSPANRFVSGNFDLIVWFVIS